MEEAVLHRKPIASRALYILIERRLKEGLGWPDCTYNSSTHAPSCSSVAGLSAVTDGVSDIDAIDKLDRHEPLLPGRRAPHLVTQQISPTQINGHKLLREKSNFGHDEQVLLRGSTNGSSATTHGLTQEALNELVPASRLASRKLFHDIIMRKSSAIATSTADSNDEPMNTRRTQNSNNFSPIKTFTTVQRGNVIVPHNQQQQQQQSKAKTRSLPNSTLDHANQNSFHLPHDPLATMNNGNRTPKNLSRTSHVEPTTRKTQQNSSVRYNQGTMIVFISKRETFSLLLLILIRIRIIISPNFYFLYFYGFTKRTQLILF